MEFKTSNSLHIIEHKEEAAKYTERRTWRQEDLGSSLTSLYKLDLWTQQVTWDCKLQEGADLHWWKVPDSSLQKWNNRSSQKGKKTTSTTITKAKWLGQTTPPYFYTPILPVALDIHFTPIKLAFNSIPFKHSLSTREKKLWHWGKPIMWHVQSPELIFLSS